MIISLCQKILIKIGGKEGTAPLPSAKKIRFGFFVQIHILDNLKISVVDFVLKKLLAYFEMLIVPHALQCVDGCFFLFYRIWHFASGILNSDLNSLANSFTRELNIKVVGFVPNRY